MIAKLLSILAAFITHIGAGEAPTEPPTVASQPAITRSAPAHTGTPIVEHKATPHAPTAADVAPGAELIPGLGVDPMSLSIVTTPAAPTAVAAGLSANQIVGKVQTFYGRTQQLKAKFRQTYTNKIFGKKSVSDGKVYIKKPGKMRWDYVKNKRIRKSFISDGTTLWAVEHHNRQVFIKDLKENMLPVAVTFLYGKGDLRRDFNASLDASGKYGAKGDYVVVLKPKKPSQYKSLRLVVAGDDFRVKQSVVTESSGNVNHFRFYEPNTTTPAQDKWFFFNVKKVKGYRIVKRKPAAKRKP